MAPTAIHLEQYSYFTRNRGTNPQKGLPNMLTQLPIKPYKIGKQRCFTSDETMEPPVAN